MNSKSLFMKATLLPMFNSRTHGYFLFDYMCFFMYGYVASLQVRCFSAPLQPTEISGVKRAVQEKMPEGVNNNTLTLTGFLFLHALFIEKGRLETTWTVLRKFGYDNDIKLRDDLIAMPIKRAPDQVMFYILYEAHKNLSMSI